MEQSSTIVTTASAPYSLSLKNDRLQPINFFVEPWGEAYSMLPGATYYILTDSPIQGTIHIEYQEDGIAVWASTSIQIFHDGIEIGGDNGPRQQPPAVPQK